MARVVECQAGKFKGRVVLSDPILYPQYLAYQRAIRDAARLPDDTGVELRFLTLVPGLLACVERFDIPGLPERLTAEEFPLSPLSSAMRLLSTISDGVRAILDEEDEIPKG